MHNYALQLPIGSVDTNTSNHLRSQMKLLHVLSLLFGVAALCACGESPHLREGPFTDVNGRTCTVQCTGASCSLTGCTATPAPSVACEPGDAPGFVVSDWVPVSSAYRAGLCDGCISASTRGAYFRDNDCVAIACVEAGDCPFHDNHCVDGLCTTNRAADGGVPDAM